MGEKEGFIFYFCKVSWIEVESEGLLVNVEEKINKF